MSMKEKSSVNNSMMGLNDPASYHNFRASDSNCVIKES
jgi:hypothetical protein